MAKFRVETVVDHASSKIYAELYYPETAATPQATTELIYSTHEEAERDVIETFRKAFPKRSRAN